MSITLDDGWTKLSRAEHHLNILQAGIGQFWQDHPYRITLDKNVDQCKYTFHVRDLHDPDPEWGLIVGDCAHNARASLDYVMTRIVAIVTGEDPAMNETAQFPIYWGEGAPKRFNGDRAISELIKNHAFEGYIATLRALQPYNLGNPSIWGTFPVEAYGPIRPILLADDGQGGFKPIVPDHAPAHSPLPIGLQHLAQLDNIDKHRSIHRVQYHVQGPEFTGYMTYEDPYDRLEPPSGLPAGTQMSRSTVDPVEDGAEVGSITFPSGTDCSWTPSEVEMKRHFPIEVAIRYRLTNNPDEFVEMRDAVAALSLCIWSVRMVLSIFGPVFAHPRKPPLPVTVALPPSGN